MLRDAFNEIRLHPGRFVATLLAIAISVGFIAAISILVNTEKQSLGRSGSLDISTADVVVKGSTGKPAEVVSAIKSVDGVRAAEPSLQQISMLTHGESTVMVTAIQLPGEAFRWSELKSGRWPSGMTEIALSSDGLDKLKVTVGDKVHIGDTNGPEMTVTGETRDAKSLFGVTGYVDLGSDSGLMPANTFVVKTDGDPAAAVAAISAAVAQADPATEFTVSTGEEARQAAMQSLTGGFDVFKYLLLAFAGVALVVGIIIISNTFTILVTQRRRQIGLLRAVGASSSQVRGRLILEALIIGLVGSILGVLLGLGVALLGATITGSIFWGLVFQPLELAGAVAVGVIATLISVLGPSLAATRVSPLEALQPVPTAAQAKRIGMVRIVVCALFALIGVALVAFSMVERTYSLVWAMLAGTALTVAILGAAPLYIPAVLRLLGKVFGATGPTTRLAAENSARNPQRAAATAVALMLAVGLVVTLQVALASTRASAMSAIDEHYPIDVSVRAQVPLEDSFMDSVRNSGGVKSLVPVASKDVQLNGELLSVRNVNPARSELGLPDKLAAPDDAIIVSNGSGLSGTVQLPGDAGAISLRVVLSESVGYGQAAVSQSVFDQLTGKAETREFWVKLTDRTSTTALNQVMRAIDAGPPNLEREGGAMIAGLMTQVLNVLLIILTALLGVAVVIALVGVGNTLGLSVIERQRESALLRALGMQRASLRVMLLIEALLLALVGTVIGVAAGAFFGWLAVSSTLRMMPDDTRPDLHFAVDPWWTLLLIAVCVGAACLASVLPGRRAANATPTEALAAE